MDKVPFPLERKESLTIRDINYLTVFAASAIKALAQTGRTSMVIWEGEPPPLPHREKRWQMFNVSDESTLPIEVQRRINILRYHDIPIKQIIKVDERPPEKPKKQPWLQSQPAPKITPLSSPDTARKAKKVKKVSDPIDWERFFKTTLVAAAILGGIYAGISILPILVMAIKEILGFLLLPLLLLGGMFVAVYDPIVIVVLDDGQDSWLMVGMWYE